MPKPGPKIRLIADKDLEELYAIDQSCFPTGVSYSKDELRWFATRRGALGYVAEWIPESETPPAGKPIVGFILAWMKPRQIGHIITLDILENFRRRSIGSKLMNPVEEDFRKAAIRMAVLEVSVKNLPAQAFYKKFRYRTAERLAAYYPNGEDAFEMIKVLGSEIKKASPKK